LLEPHAIGEALARRDGERKVRGTARSSAAGSGRRARRTPTSSGGDGARALPGRPVKLALTRQQMFSLAGYRTPTIQRLQVAANGSGRLTAIAIDVIEQTSKIKELAEQTGVPTRMVYTAASRRTTHRLAALDVPVPSWMRAPGECPGMFGPEVALDELAGQLGIDPVELRIRNEPDVDPATGQPWSSRHLVECLREGARRFCWRDRDPRPGARRDGEWLTGAGVASSVYPTMRMAQSAATIRFSGGRYIAEIGAADLGTGAWTVLPQIAADTLGVPAGQDDPRLQRQCLRGLRPPCPCLQHPALVGGAARQKPGTSAVRVHGSVPGAPGLVDPAFFRVVEFAGVA
jgi:xanthine dehydrogenase YagR molybdenum-binding subunit